MMTQCYVTPFIECIEICNVLNVRRKLQNCYRYDNFSTMSDVHKTNNMHLFKGHVFDFESPVPHVIRGWRINNDVSTDTRSYWLMTFDDFIRYQFWMIFLFQSLYTQFMLVSEAYGHCIIILERHNAPIAAYTITQSEIVHASYTNPRQMWLLWTQEISTAFFP